MSALAHSLRDAASISLRPPTAHDAAAVWRLLGEVGNLERNSCYAYLLLCSHFAETCVLAEHAGKLVGFVLAYRPPSEPAALFVWQVGVAHEARGAGLGVRMLEAALQLPGARGARFLTATVTADNRASLAMFRGLARSLDVRCMEQTGFVSTLFAEPHAGEDIVRIGPLKGST